MIARYKPRIFYVYALFDENGIVRYIGKGKGNRWLSHDKGNDPNNWCKNKFIKQTLRNLGEIPKVKLRQKLTEPEAFEIEVAFIKAIGRCPNGPLYNLTDNRNGPSSETIKAWHASRTPEERSATAKKSAAAFGPERRSIIASQRAAAIPKEEHSRRFKAIMAAVPFEVKSANGKKGGAASAAASTLEEKQERGHKGIAAYMAQTTPEQRRKNYKKTGVGKLTKEQLSTNGTKGATTANNNRTPEERSALGSKAAAALHASRTPEERIERARMAGLAAQKFITPEIRSAAAFKRAETLGEEGLRVIALKVAATRKLRGCKIGNFNKGWRLINNGIVMRALAKTERLPTGWRYGMLKRSK